MLITVKKEVEETIEVKTPCWLYDQFSKRYIHITEEGDLIKVSQGMIILWDKGEANTINEIRIALRDCNSCSEMEFKEALDKELYKLEETYTRA